MLRTLTVPTVSHRRLAFAVGFYRCLKDGAVNSQHQKVIRGWAKLLNPVALKDNLIVASLFLAAYETLKTAIIDQIRNFYCCGFNEQGEIISPNYQAKVLALDKSRLLASLLWLKNNNAIDDADIARIQQIRQHRNELAHELQRFLATAEAEINIDLLGSIYDLVTKIDRWWIREVEIPTNPDFDGQDVADKDIQSGRMLFLHLMVRIAGGDDSTELYETFLQQVGEQMHEADASAESGTYPDQPSGTTC